VALRGDLDQALGRERDLAGQLAAVREQLAARDSELGALRTHVVAPLEERLAAAQRAIEAQLTELAQVHRGLAAAQATGAVEGATVRLRGGGTLELVPGPARAALENTKLTEMAREAERVAAERGTDDWPTLEQLKRDYGSSG
jgi:hypothetical protein